MILKVLGFKQVAKHNGFCVHGVHFVHHEQPKSSTSNVCMKSIVIPLPNFGLLNRPMFRQAGFTELYVSLSIGHPKDFRECLEPDILQNKNNIYLII